MLPLPLHRNPATIARIVRNAPAQFMDLSQTAHARIQDRGEINRVFASYPAEFLSTAIQYPNWRSNHENLPSHEGVAPPLPVPSFEGSTACGPRRAGQRYASEVFASHPPPRHGQGPRRVGRVPLARTRRQCRALRSSATHRRGRSHACARQYICCPPLMLSVDPVTNPPSSEHRNATPRAISLAWPRRPTGILATIFSSTSAGTAATMSVSI